MNKPTCHVCPFTISTQKQLSIAVKALRDINTAEARHALQTIRILAGLHEPHLCQQQEGDEE